MIVDILIGLVLCVMGALLLNWWYTRMSESEKWDIAAINMRFKGRTDLEIIQAIGLRPEDGV